MKREMDEDINWGSLFLKVILAFVLVLLIIWIISKFILNRSEDKENNEFVNNLNKMYEVAEEYFENESKLPKNGEHSTMTLKEMIEEGIIGKLKYGDTTCSTKSSYAKVSNKDGKYTLKVLLTCGSESDYISKVIKVEDSSEEEKEESKNESTTNTNNNSSNSSSNTSNNSTNSSSNNTTTSTVVETEEVVVTDYTKMEYKFCKIENEEYYTVVYLNSSDVEVGYQTTYTIKLNDLTNINKIDVNKDNYFLYRTYYNRYKNNLESNFSIIDGKSAKGIANVSKNFIKAALKSNNFSYKLTNVYEKDGSYYIDVEITIKKVSKYTDTYNGTKINYVPVYFSVSYADLSNCVTDTYTNSGKYASYYVIK